MATIRVTWDPVTVDDGGAPVVVSSYRVQINDGAYSTPHVDVTAPTTQADIDVGTDTGPFDFNVRAAGPAGFGVKSANVQVVIPSGVPATPENVVAVIL